MRGAWPPHADRQPTNRISRRTVLCRAVIEGYISATTRGESHVRSQARDTRARFPGTGCSDLGDARRCRHGIPPTFGGLETIVVTATRRAEDLQNGSESISAFGTEAIEMRGLKQMDDYAKFHPRPFAGCARARGHDHRVPRVRLVRTPVARPSFFRAISGTSSRSRRAAGIPIPAVRHRAARGAARASGTLYGACSQSGTLPASPTSRSVRVRWLGRLAGHQCRRGREGYDASVMFNVPLSGTASRALRGIHRGGCRVHRQRPERKSAWSDIPREGTFDNADRSPMTSMRRHQGRARGAALGANRPTLT
jgi:hypothetical protein